MENQTGEATRLLVVVFSPLLLLLLLHVIDNRRVLFRSPVVQVLTRAGTRVSGSRCRLILVPPLSDKKKNADLKRIERLDVYISI